MSNTLGTVLRYGRKANRFLNHPNPTRRKITKWSLRILGIGGGFHKLVPTHFIYILIQETLSRLQSDVALEMATNRFAAPVGSAIIGNEIVPGSDFDWTNLDTLPKETAIPFGATASAFGFKTPNERGAEFVPDDWVLGGCTTTAEAIALLHHQVLEWKTKCEKTIKKADGYHGLLARFRLEQIAVNMFTVMANKVFTYTFPGNSGPRRYGPIRTRNQNFTGNYYYWNKGPKWNGKASIHYRPGKPSWSAAQYVAKKRFQRMKRRKNPLDARCKPFNKIQVRVPVTAYERPPIGRRLKKFLTAKGIFLTPLKKKVGKLKQFGRQNLVSVDRKMENLRREFNENTLPEMCAELGKTAKKYASKRFVAMQHHAAREIAVEVSSALIQANRAIDGVVVSASGLNRYVTMDESSPLNFGQNNPDGEWDIANCGAYQLTRARLQASGVPENDQDRF